MGVVYCDVYQWPDLNPLVKLLLETKRCLMHIGDFGSGPTMSRPTVQRAKDLSLSTSRQLVGASGSHGFGMLHIPCSLIMLFY